MTRRKFIHQLAQMSSLLVAGVVTFARRTSAQKTKLRKFVRAVPLRYPGRVSSQHEIFEQSKWSG